MTISSTNISFSSINNEISGSRRYGASESQTSQLDLGDLELRALGNVAASGAVSFSQFANKNGLNRGVPSDGTNSPALYSWSSNTNMFVYGGGQLAVSGLVNYDGITAMAGKKYIYDSQAYQTVTVTNEHQAGLSYSRDGGRTWTNSAFPDLTAPSRYGAIHRIYKKGSNWYVFGTKENLVGYSYYDGSPLYSTAPSIFKSPDLVTWTDISSYFPLATAVAYNTRMGGDKFVISTQNKIHPNPWYEDIYTSTDGINWTNYQASYGSNESGYGAYSYTLPVYNEQTDVWAWQRQYGGSTPNTKSKFIYGTNNGTSWATVDVPYDSASGYAGGVTTHNDYSMFVMGNYHVWVGYSTNQNWYVYRSSNGSTWTYQKLPIPTINVNGNIYQATFGSSGAMVVNGTLVLIGVNGCLYTSTDQAGSFTDRTGQGPWGQNYTAPWVLGDEPPNVKQERFIMINHYSTPNFFGNLVGQLYSTDGINWSAPYTGQNSIVSIINGSINSLAQVRGTIMGVSGPDASGLRTVYYG